MMPLGPPMAFRILVIPAVPAVMKFAVAFEIEPTTDSSKSPTPWKVSLIPAPSALMFWLLPDANEVMLCPNREPIPAKTDPCPVFLNEFSWSNMSLLQCNMLSIDSL